MTGKKPPTHRAYLILREGRRFAGYWKESGDASIAENGTDIKIYASMIPVSGFDGHILLRPIDAEPAPLPPIPDDDDDLNQPTDDDPYLGAPRRG